MISVMLYIGYYIQEGSDICNVIYIGYYIQEGSDICNVIYRLLHTGGQ